MKKLKCPISQCRKTYRSRFTLRRHVQAYHYRTKRFACERCDKSFAYRHTLRKHIRRIHSNTPATTEIPQLTHLLRFCSDPELNPFYVSPVEEQQRLV